MISHSRPGVELIYANFLKKSITELTLVLLSLLKLFFKQLTFLQVF